LLPPACRVRQRTSEQPLLLRCSSDNGGGSGNTARVHETRGCLPPCLACMHACMLLASLPGVHARYLPAQRPLH
jgi:hypothetical protein